MHRNMRTGLTAVAALLGAVWIVTGQLSAQQAPQGAPAAQAGGRGQAAPIVEGQCPPARGGGGAAAGTPRPKRVLAWADSRNGRSQHQYVSYALGQIQQMGHKSKAYDLIIRTDSDVISFNPKMTDGKTPASGGPNLCNVDAILFASHRNVPLSAQQKSDLISALKDKGIGFVVLYVGTLPNTDFPEMANIIGTKLSSINVHSPFDGDSTFINESPDSPMTRHLPKVWNAPISVYHPVDYTRNDIHVLLRKDLSKLPAHAAYLRDDGDYPVAWTKMYGKSRVFTSTIGDGAAMWDDPMVVKMYDEAIKWSLGLTQYDVKPHPLPADARGPIGPRPPLPAPGAGRGAAPAAQ